MSMNVKVDSTTAVTMLSVPMALVISRAIVEWDMMVMELIAVSESLVDFEVHVCVCWL